MCGSPSHRRGVAQSFANSTTDLDYLGKISAIQAEAVPDLERLPARASQPVAGTGKLLPAPRQRALRGGRSLSVTFGWRRLGAAGQVDVARLDDDDFFTLDLPDRDRAPGDV